MITLMRNAISATMGMAVIPVSYTCRAIAIGRRRRVSFRHARRAALLEDLVEQAQLIRWRAPERHRRAGRARAAHELAQRPGAREVERRELLRRNRHLPRCRNIDRGESGLDEGEPLRDPLARQLELQALVGAPNLDAHAWRGA